MKKWIAWLLVLTMALSLAACADKEEEKPKSIKDAAWHETKADILREKEEMTVPEKEETKPARLPAMEEQVVVDNEEVVIRLGDIHMTEYGELAVRCYCENKSQDTTYRFTVQDGAINGISNDPLFVPEISPGKKSNEELTFWVDELTEMGITEFTDIWLDFYVYDANDFMADPVAEAQIHLYPYGPEKATAYVREDQPEDIVLMDTPVGKAVVIGAEMDEIWGYTLNLYLENRTDVSMMFSADEVSVNGYMADPFFARSVAPHTCSFTTMSWSEDTFETNGITEVEEIELVLDVYDKDDWSAEDYYEERVIFQPAPIG